MWVWTLGFRQSDWDRAFNYSTDMSFMVACAATTPGTHDILVLTKLLLFTTFRNCNDSRVSVVTRAPGCVNPAFVSYFFLCYLEFEDGCWFYY